MALSFHILSKKYLYWQLYWHYLTFILTWPIVFSRQFQTQSLPLALWSPIVTWCPSAVSSLHLKAALVNWYLISCMKLTPINSPMTSTLLNLMDRFFFWPLGNKTTPLKIPSLLKLLSSLIFLFSFNLAAPNGSRNLSSPSRDQNWVVAVQVLSPNRWTTREFPGICASKSLEIFSLSGNSPSVCFYRPAY